MDHFHERIFALWDALDFQKKALVSGNFYLWRGARFYIDEFWSRPSSTTREEFDRTRAERRKK